MLADTWQDVRYALRSLRKSPGFTLVALITLALGIGANTAAFSVVNGILLLPLPYAEPEQLVAVYELSENGAENRVAYPNFEDWRAQSRSFMGMAAYMAWDMNVLGAREPVRTNAAMVSREFLDVMAVRPMLGRAFVEEELVMGGRPAVLVSEDFWRLHLGARPLGETTLQLAGFSAEVVGVLPAGFDYPAKTQVWAPLELLPMDMKQSRSANNYQVVARLRPGVAVEAAQRELSALMPGIEARDPDNSAASVAVRELLEDQVSGARRSVLVLLGAAALVLLVACTNLASALLARATARGRELAVRSSLGAHRARLIRQFLVENLILAVAGATIGIALAFLVVRGLIAVGPTAFPRLENVRIDPVVLGFTTLITVITALLFGTLPALRATAITPGDVLRGGSHSASGPRTRRAWSGLIGVEVAMTLVLLVGAGLLIRSFWNIIRTDPGFEPVGVVTVPIELPDTKYADPAARIVYYDRAIDALRTIPGVQSVAATMSVPLVGRDPNGAFMIEGREFDRQRQASYRVVTPDFFSTMRIPLVGGRMFNTLDRAGALPVMVINERMAQLYFPGENPIGRRIRTMGMDGSGDIWVTIVGVVENVRHRSLTSPGEPAYYLPLAQRPDRILYSNFVVRARASDGEVMQPVRAALRRIDPDVPVEVSTLTSGIGKSVADRRLVATLLVGFAAIALTLAGVGIYGVVAFAVAQRSREIGIRVAIGASRPAVLWAVSRSVVFALAFGTAAGMLASTLLSRLAAGLLHGVQPFDIATFVGVAITILTVGALAAVIPAARALRVNPILTLRSD